MSHSDSTFKCSSHTTNGSSRQDRTLAVQIPVPETGITLAVAGVWDGHSINGEVVATIARDMTYAYFQQVAASWVARTDAEWYVELMQLFDMIHRHFEFSMGGTTASIAFCFVQADGTKSRLIHANVGDSPIYVIDKTTRANRVISADHSPDNLEEANRLQQFGSRAMYPIYMTQVPYTTRIFIADPNNAGMVMKDPSYENHNVLWAMRCSPSTVDYDPQVYFCSTTGNIAVSRAIGDYKHVPYGMSHAPCVGSTVLGDNEFVAIMSDGVTDVIQRGSLSGYLIDTIAPYESLEQALAKVTTDANQTWYARFGSADDASIAVIA